MIKEIKVWDNVVRNRELSKNKLYIKKELEILELKGTVT